MPYRPECEICDKPLPEDEGNDEQLGWDSVLDGPEWDDSATYMWFCPTCIEKWGSNE